MTIGEAIDFLTKLEKKHGGKVPVYFDCPRCLQAFTPTQVVTETVHLKAPEKKP